MIAISHGALRPRPAARLLLLDPEERLLLFRFAYKDSASVDRSHWATPGGGVDAGETFEQAAIRELWEETGLRCSLGDRLVEILYPTPRGEDKRVRWWAMTVDSDDGFRPGRETDERRWVPLDDVDRLLSWDTDRTVLDRFRSVLGA